LPETGVEAANQVAQRIVKALHDGMGRRFPSALALQFTHDGKESKPSYEGSRGYVPMKAKKRELRNAR